MYRAPIFSMTFTRRERRVGAMVKVMRVIRIRGWIMKAMKRLRGVNSGLRIGCHNIGGVFIMGARSVSCKVGEKRTVQSRRGFC